MVETVDKEYVNSQPVLKQNIASCQNTKSLKTLLKHYRNSLDAAYEEGLFS